mgnify:CR=1 FL=1
MEVTGEELERKRKKTKISITTGSVDGNFFSSQLLCVLLHATCYSLEKLKYLMKYS